MTSPELQKWLLENGYSWVSSKYPRFQAGGEREGPTPSVMKAILQAQYESQPHRYPSGLLEIPMSPISDVNAFRSLRWSLPQFLRATEACVMQAIKTKTVFDFLCHPSCMVVEDPGLVTIKRICQLAREHRQGGAKVVTLDEIAAQFPASPPSPRNSK